LDLHEKYAHFRLRTNHFVNDSYPFREQKVHSQTPTLRKP
jgi:hypothetical protein